MEFIKRKEIWVEKLNNLNWVDQMGALTYLRSDSTIEMSEGLLGDSNYTGEGRLQSQKEI